MCPIPVLSSRVSEKGELQLAHGSHTKPTFESLGHCDALDKLTCLVRSVDTAPPSKDIGIKFMVRKIPTHTLKDTLLFMYPSGNRDVAPKYIFLLV